MFPWWISWLLRCWVCLASALALLTATDILKVEARGRGLGGHNHLIGFSGSRGFGRGFFSGGGARHYRGFSNSHYSAKIKKPSRDLASKEVFLSKQPKLNGISSQKGAAGTLGGELKGPELGMGGSAVQPHNPTIGQQFATQPAPQTAVVGSTAVLPCRYVYDK